MSNVYSNAVFRSSCFSDLEFDASMLLGTPYTCRSGYTVCAHCQEIFWGPRPMSTSQYAKKTYMETSTKKNWNMDQPKANTKSEILEALERVDTVSMVDLVQSCLGTPI